MPLAETTARRRRGWSWPLAAACLTTAGLAATGAPADAAGLLLEAPRVAACPAGPEPEGDEHWIASWSTAPSDSTIVRPFAEQTIRQVITPLFDGDTVRLRLQHRYGTADVTVTDVAVARQLDGPSLVPGSVCGLTFGGETTVTVPAGGEITSDPFTYDVTRLDRLAIDMHVVGAADQTTRHYTSFEEPYVTNVGNASGEESGASFMGSVFSVENSWHLLAGLDVVAPATTGVVVAFGDSITDGFGNTADAYCLCDPLPVGTDTRYPDFLARRLAVDGVALGVANAGIGGNELLGTGLQPQSGIPGIERFTDDVLAVPGVTHVVVLIGTNDIGNRPDTDPAALIAGYEQLIGALQDAGLHVTQGTITPAGGTVIGENAFGIGVLHGTPEADAKRETVNAWIRDRSPADAIVDFDACLRDPAVPSRLLAAYDSGDHLHPNAAGYEAMADCLDLAVFTAGTGDGVARSGGPADVVAGVGDDEQAPSLPVTGGGSGIVAAAALALGALSRRRPGAARR